MLQPRTAEFSVGESLCLADEILSRPPAKPFIRRPELLPTRVFRTALPSELCLASNEWARRNRFGDSAVKDKIWSLLEPQALVWRSKLGHWWPFSIDTLPSHPEQRRPQVIAIKFSARGRPDSGANFAKMPIDMLQKARVLKRTGPFGLPTMTPRRLGVIVDDSETQVEQLCWWEFTSAKFHPFVVLEVRV